MIKLTCLLRRKPGTTHEEFLAHWRGRHGPLVASTASGGYVVRYEQHPRAAVAGPDDYDGVAEQWFASADDFWASLRADDYHLIAEDIERFLDPGALVWLLTDEPSVVIDGAPDTSSDRR